MYPPSRQISAGRRHSENVAPSKYKRGVPPGQGVGVRRVQPYAETENIWAFQAIAARIQLTRKHNAHGAGIQRRNIYCKSLHPCDLGGFALLKHNSKRKRFLRRSAPANDGFGEDAAFCALTGRRRKSVFPVRAAPTAVGLPRMTGRSSHRPRPPPTNVLVVLARFFVAYAPQADKDRVRSSRITHVTGRLTQRLSHKKPNPTLSELLF